MSQIKLTVLHTGTVNVPYSLPFGGSQSMKAGNFENNTEDRLLLPVSVYLIEHPKYGKIVVDTGWNRSIAPDGKFDEATQIKSLGSELLFKAGPADLPLGKAAVEQLADMGIQPSDIDYVLVTHMDDDHAHGINQFKGAKHILCSKAELDYVNQDTHGRYNKDYWSDVELETFEWNQTEGPAHKSYDLFGDGSIVLINIPGHTDGLFAVRITGDDGKFVLLFSDGGYARKSWEELITSGVAANKEMQLNSLKWIREQSLDKNCVESMANHDPDIEPHTVLL